MPNKTILVSAYSCEPNKGSEPGVGWDYVSEMQNFHRLIVVTRTEKSHILIPFENPNLKFVFVSVPYFTKKSKYGLLAYLHYYLWQLAAYFHVSKNIDLNEIDIYHHITFVNSWTPSFLPFLKRKKFIWGPIGQHPEIPTEYLSSINHPKAYFNELIRKHTRKGLKLIDPFFHLTKSRADYILCIDRNTSNEFKNRFIQVLPAISIDTTKFTDAKIPSNKFKIYFCGNLVYWKGIYLALEAFKQFSQNKSDVEFYIIGGGKEKDKLVNSVKDDPKIIFIENLPQPKLFQLIKEFNVFLYPSFEGGGMVVLEALAMGKPIICLDYGGPGSMVKESCGFKTTYTNFTNTTKSLADDLEKYYLNSALLEEHSKNAKNHVKSNFELDKKIQKILSVYEDIL